MKHTGFALIGAVLLLCPLTACGSSEPKNVVEEADMPYGSTISMDTQKSVPMQYDNRFVDDALAEKLAEYYFSVQENDVEKYQPLPFPLYHQYQMETVNGGKFTDADVLTYTHDYYQNLLGEDFDFALIDITNAVNSDGVSENRDALVATLDSLANEKGQELVSDKTEMLVELQITCWLTKKGSGEQGETDLSADAETVYGLLYDGQWYLI